MNVLQLVFTCIRSAPPKNKKSIVVLFSINGLPLRGFAKPLPRCDWFDRMQIPQEQKNLLDERRARVREGKVRLIEWDSGRGSIGKRCPAF